ncbi:MAG: hypothetical protein M3552_12450 [Planctomycetota bacterium]|nr:hypothetical protein [Planctomycetaceae bacterium]MDQ3331444.1 hypothetical protein [Planctomycetota bacterium]
MTGRERQLIESLARKVRMISFEQIARTWWPRTAAGKGNARRRIAGLVREGWLSEFRVLSQPMLPLDGPESVWQPGDPAPDFGSMSWRLRSRWKGSAAPLRVFTIGRHGAALFAATSAGIKNACHVTHDLHVTGIFLRLLADEPDAAERWIGEDAFTAGRKREKRPDALLVGEAGLPVRVIEFGGAYPPQRLREFHDHCVARRLPYEIW